MVEKMCNGNPALIPVKLRGLRVCVESFPGDPFALCELGKVLCEMGELEEGIVFYDQAVATGVQVPNLQSHLSRARQPTRRPPSRSQLVEGVLSSDLRSDKYLFRA